MIKDDKLKAIIKAKKTNLILSLDITNEFHFFNILIDCVSVICGIKIHSDILPFAHNQTFYDKLNELAIKYDFIIIEDRKLADIGYINKLQAQYYKNYGIDYMTCHSFMGRSAVESIDSNMKLFLISDMSCKDSYIDDSICHDMFIENTNIIGFVSQKKQENEKFINQPLYLRPGIKIIDEDSSNNNNNDCYGQQYTTPKVYPGILWVVGRNITQDEDPYKQALKYQCIFEKSIKSE
jgi:uridine monophosphate synthetase